MERRKPEDAGHRPPPYPSWTMMASQIRGMVGTANHSGTDADAKGWHDLLADDASANRLEAAPKRDHT